MTIFSVFLSSSFVMVGKSGASSAPYAWSPWLSTTWNGTVGPVRNYLESEMNIVQHKKNSYLKRGIAALMAVAIVSGTVATHGASAAPAQNPAVEAARDLSTAFRSASEHVLHAVVAIESRAAKPTGGEEFSAPEGFPDGANPFEGSPFEDLFRKQFKNARPTCRSRIAAEELARASSFTNRD